MLDSRAPGVERLRGVLSSRGYLEADLDGVLGVAFGPSHLRSDLPLYERRLAAPTPLHTLMRLFGLYVAVPEGEARAAFEPLDLEAVEAMGLLERGDGLVRSLVGLVTTGDLVLARDRLASGASSLRSDHVIGLNPPAMQLGSLTVRRPVRAALDLGCGGGVQALTAAGHAERVVAVDVNPRALEFTRFNARVNGIANVECRQGDFFAPVQGERFGLVVCNPPYAISPDARYVFRDSGRPGDAVCEDIVRRIPAHLEEGGFATVLCNWAPDHGDYAASIDRWLAYYRDKGIEALGMGAVILRRRSRTGNWVREDQLPADPVGRCHEQILRVFAAEDLLTGLDEAALLAQVFVAGDDHRLYQTLVRRDDDYGLETAELRLTGGFGFRGAADGSTLELLRRCDGRRRLGAVLGELAELARADRDVLVKAALPAVRRLMALGFLLPVEAREKRRTSDGGNGEVATETDAPAEGVPRVGERVGAGGGR